MKVILRWKLPAGPHADARRAPDFYNPLPTALRIAVLAGGFRETKLIRIFPEGLNPGVMIHEPQAIAGSIKVLRALARTARLGHVRFPHLQYAAIVLTDVDGELLAPADRDLLWHTFGVPVYEQLIGPRGETLASECEAHNGLHVIHPDCPSEHLATMMRAHLESAPCGCGRPGLRFVTLAPVPPTALPALVAAKAANAAA